MGDGPTAIGIHVTVDQGDVEEVASATASLRRELLELDVDDVVPAPGLPPPPGTRAVDAAGLGALIVSVTSSRLFSSILQTIRSWLTAQPQRSITLQIDGDVLELSGVSAEEQTRLADEWLSRHASP